MRSRRRNFAPTLRERVRERLGADPKTVIQLRDEINENLDLIANTCYRMVNRGEAQQSTIGSGRGARVAYSLLEA